VRAGEIGLGLKSPRLSGGDSLGRGGEGHYSSQWLFQAQWGWRCSGVGVGEMAAAGVGLPSVRVSDWGLEDWRERERERVGEGYVLGRVGEPAADRASRNSTRVTLTRQTSFVFAYTRTRSFLTKPAFYLLLYTLYHILPPSLLLLIALKQLVVARPVARRDEVVLAHDP